jgi:hypothetical protein
MLSEDALFNEQESKLTAALLDPAATNGTVFLPCNVRLCRLLRVQMVTVFAIAQQTMLGLLNNKCWKRQVLQLKFKGLVNLRKV